MDSQDRILIAIVEAALGLTLVLIVIAILIVNAMAEAVLERERQKTRQMEQSLNAHQAALQEKERERAMLMAQKEEMLAEVAAKENLVDEFMGFIEATENKDPEMALNFDEKAMMDTILSMMKSDCGDGGDNGGFTGGDNVPKIKLDIEERAIMDAAIAMINSDGNCDSNNGGFAGNNGGINNPPENAPNLGEEATMAANKDTNSEGEGEGASGHGKCH